MRIANQLATIVAAFFLAAAVPAIAEPASAKLLKSTADHGKFKVLNQEFASGPEVTKACLSCHTEAAKQIHQTLEMGVRQSANQAGPGQEAHRQ